MTEIFFYSNYVHDIFVDQKISEDYGKIIKSDGKINYHIEAMVI